MQQWVDTYTTPPYRPLISAFGAKLETFLACVCLGAGCALPLACLTNLSLWHWIDDTGRRPSEVELGQNEMSQKHTDCYTTSPLRTLRHSKTTADVAASSERYEIEEQNLQHI